MIVASISEKDSNNDCSKIALAHNSSTLLVTTKFFFSIITITIYAIS